MGTNRSFYLTHNANLSLDTKRSSYPTHNGNLSGALSGEESGVLRDR